MNIIQQITKDCPREDCSMLEGGSTSTCMGWQPTYDKAGQRIDKGDPNTHTTSWRCSSCNRAWVTNTRYGETSITETTK